MGSHTLWVTSSSGSVAPKLPVLSGNPCLCYAQAESLTPRSGAPSTGQSNNPDNKGTPGFKPPPPPLALPKAAAAKNDAS